MHTGININTKIINWAITRAGYKFQDFVLKFPRVQDWVTNKKKPTLKQLEEFSSKVHVPFGYLFLDTPPIEKLPIPFFRTGNSGRNNVSLNVFDTILLLQKRQEWLNDYLKENEAEELVFAGKFKSTSNYKEIVADIRKTLNLDEDWAASMQTWELALEHLVRKIEDAGVIVVFNSVVENNSHRPITVEECRGFILVDNMAPFMFINAADAKAAQMFTVVHELAHIWAGHSAGFDFKQLQPADDPVEKLCDMVAAEFLVPENTFHAAWAEKTDIKYLSRRFKVSPIVIARRALDLGKLSRREFFKFYNAYVQKIQQKKNAQSGGDFYATQKKRLSIRFASYINEAVKENKLLYRDAYKMTGLKGDTYQTFMSKYLY